MRQPKNLSAFLLLAFSVGCSTTGQVSHQFATVEKSGFLGDYSILREGERGEALFIYANPAYEERYDKILLEPITVWCSEETGLGDLSREDAQHLAHYLHNALVRELSDDFKLVDASGPGVLRIRSAITEARNDSSNTTNVSA